MRFKPEIVDRYVRHNRVEGWLLPFSATFIAALSRFQVERGLAGSVAEIGVHHGKSFFVLYLTTREDEVAIAIDVFDAQHLNLDNSGRGSKEVFLRHARRLNSSLDGIRIIEDSSLHLSVDRIRSEGGRVRLFSIDGAHTEEATGNDLRLAEECIHDQGAVIVDDCFNEFWPEVSGGLARYLYGSGRLVPFSIAPNKVFLCFPEMRATYENFVSTTFPQEIEKRAKLYGHQVQIVGVLPKTLRRRIGKTALGKWLKRMRR